VWTAMRVMWVIFLVISSVYQYVWDIAMDWGLLRNLWKKKATHRLLREDRLYTFTWVCIIECAVESLTAIQVYYVAIVTDLIARFFWSLSISPTMQLLPDVYFTMMAAFIEIAR